MNKYRSLGLDLAQATERTARAVMVHSGKGDRNRADQAAVETLRTELNGLGYEFRVAIGEGEKDKAPMLYSGELLGNGTPPGLEPGRYDLVVDPLECTTNFAAGLPDSTIVVAAVAPDCVQDIPGTYMEQLLVPPPMAPLIGKEITLETPPAEVVRLAAQSLERKPEELGFVIQDRPRHQELIAAVRATGAGVALIESGSISAAFEIMTGRTKRLNILWGIFGAPEGLIIALTSRFSGCGFLGRIRPHDDKTKTETAQLGLEGRTLEATEWVKGDAVLVISGLHSNPVLQGVEFLSPGNGRRVQTLLWSGLGKQIVTHTNGRLGEIRNFV